MVVPLAPMKTTLNIREFYSAYLLFIRLFRAAYGILYSEPVKILKYRPESLSPHHFQS
jgi:hypothetical protein